MELYVLTRQAYKGWQNRMCIKRGIIVLLIRGGPRKPP